MKYFIAFIIISIVIILSCNTKKENSGLFSTGNLAAEKFTINTERDTVIQTENGALLNIPANALENKDGNSVTLEIKEAYSIQQIIKAGLFTQSNGQPLSSGGMIYINAVAGQQVTFKQKIKVAIPTDYLQKGMELYKGEELANGKVNWNNPDTLPENKKLTSVEKGKILFEGKCTACHQIGKNATGPDLAQIEKRFWGEEEKDYLYYYHFIQTYNYREEKEDTIQTQGSFEKKYSGETDVRLYRCNLRNMFGSIGMAFPDLQEEDLNNIYNYIQNESDRLNLPLPGHAYLKDCVDSCLEYNNKTSELRRLKSFSQQQREKYIDDNRPMTVVIRDTIRRTSDTAGFIRKVAPKNFKATYYQFTVSSFGWYNIDMLLDKMDGVKESRLFVRIVGEYKERINIFLVIPSVKVYGEGGPAEAANDKYIFFRLDGTIPLPQNTKAFILAVTEGDDKIAYSLKEFTTGLQQEFDIELKESTKENLEAALKDFDGDRLHIKVDKTKNADSIRAKDKEIKDIDLKLKDAENLKPKNCSCDCGFTEDSGKSPAVVIISK